MVTVEILNTNPYNHVTEWKQTEVPAGALDDWLAELHRHLPNSVVIFTPWEMV